jgi:hypothetical protein
MLTRRRKQALPEATGVALSSTRPMGLSPWLGNDTDDGGSSQPYGTNYFQVTRKGLSRELGWVGTYGETILKFNRDMAELTGDAKVREQLLERHRPSADVFPLSDQSRSRTAIRQMKLARRDRQSHRALSGGAGRVRHREHPRGVVDGIAGAYLKDDVTVGAAQQCLADNHYFPRLAARAKDNDTLGMMRNIEEYAVGEGVAAKFKYRLPMSDGQPDFVFADEENAVLALKHGEQRLFVNFYYRQEFGVSGVTRILDLTPSAMRIGSVLSQFEVDASGRQLDAAGHHRLRAQRRLAAAG